MEGSNNVFGMDFYSEVHIEIFLWSISVMSGLFLTLFTSPGVC